MGRHVDFDLAEADLQALLEGAEELSMFREIFDVDDNPHQIVGKDLLLMPPPPANDLGFPRNRAKVVFQFNERVGDLRVGRRLAVIEPQRQEYLVTT
jgi:hypothetical protein